MADYRARMFVDDHPVLWIYEGNVGSFEFEFDSFDSGHTFEFSDGCPS